MQQMAMFNAFLAKSGSRALMFFYQMGEVLGAEGGMDFV